MKTNEKFVACKNVNCEIYVNYSVRCKMKINRFIIIIIIAAGAAAISAALLPHLKSNPVPVQFQIQNQNQTTTKQSSSVCEGDRRK